MADMRRTKVDAVIRAKIVNLYNGGLSSSAIGERFGLAQGTVTTALRKAGVTLDGRHRADYCGGAGVKSARRVHAYLR